MSSSAESTRPSADLRRVTRAAVVTHGRAAQVGDGLERLVALARRVGVEVVVPPEEAERHGLAAHGDPRTAELVVVLGGDGTMLRALQTYLGTGIPVIGVNFGRVGFLSAMEPEELEEGLARAFRGELLVFELPTLEVESADGTKPAVVNGRS